MAIKYFKVLRQIFAHGILKNQYVARIQTETNFTLEMLAEMIEKKSSMSRGDIMGVLAELETTICWMLENGHPVTLGILGTFYPYIEATTVDDAESVTSKLIKRFKILFKPSTYLKNRLKKVGFVLGDNIVREVKSRK